MKVNNKSFSSEPGTIELHHIKYIQLFFNILIIELQLSSASNGYYKLQFLIIFFSVTVLQKIIK